MPASTVSLPRGWAVKPIQRFQEGIAAPSATNSVPTCSPARIFARLPGCLPLAMMTLSPAVVAICAALSLLAMPPLLRPVARSRTSDQMPSSIRITVGMRREAASRGSPSYSPSTSESSTNSGADQVCDHRGQPIVVAEGGLQFLDAHGVVLIDDRDRAEFQQRQDRVADIEISRAMIEIVGDQQDLRGVAAMLAQRTVVGFDQRRLADRRDGLQMGQIRGPASNS